MAHNALHIKQQRSALRTSRAALKLLRGKTINTKKPSIELKPNVKPTLKNNIKPNPKVTKPYNIYGGNTATKPISAKTKLLSVRAGLGILAPAAGAFTLMEKLRPTVSKTGEHHGKVLFDKMAKKIIKNTSGGRAEEGSIIAEVIAKNKGKPSIDTVSGPGLDEGQNKGQKNRVGKNIVKSKPTVDAISRHADEFSGVTIAKLPKAPSKLNNNGTGTHTSKWESKEWESRPKPTAQTISATQSKFRKEGPKSGITGGTGGEKMLKEWNGTKAKEPKPTSFDQKVSNFLGVTFSSSKTVPSKDPNRHGEMDFIPNVTAKPTGEGLDLFGGGKRRQRKRARK